MASRNSKTRRSERNSTESLGVDIFIPELEAAAKTNNNAWTDYEDSILLKYYGRVPAAAIVKVFADNEKCTTRTMASIRNRWNGRLKFIKNT